MFTIPDTRATSVKLLLAEEHPIVRSGLQALLQQREDVELLGVAGTGPQAVRLAAELGPQLVLLDVDIPELGVVQTTRQIVDAREGIRVLIMSLHAGARLVDEVLKAGASGYVGDDCDFPEMMAAVHAVVEGNTYLSPAVTKVVVAKYLGRNGDATGHDAAGLTSRELEVLQLLAQGHSTKQIALALHRGAKTVETHRQHLMQKLQVDTIAALTKYAVREGLTDLWA